MWEDCLLIIYQGINLCRKTTAGVNKKYLLQKMMKFIGYMVIFIYKKALENQCIIKNCMKNDINAEHIHSYA